MITMEDLKEAKDTLEMYNKKLEEKHKEFLEVKEVFDEETKNGLAKESTCDRLLMTMESYKNLMDVCSLHRAYALNVIALYEYQQKVKES